MTLYLNKSYLLKPLFVCICVKMFIYLFIFFTSSQIITNVPGAVLTVAWRAAASIHRWIAVITKCTS